jgi:hypothetical protein
MYIDSLNNDGSYADRVLFAQKDTSSMLVTRVVFGTNAEVEVSSGDKAKGLRLNGSYTPASASETGISAGQLKWDSDYIYVRVSSSAWKRVALATW